MMSTMVRPLHIPPLYCPIPEKDHPDSVEISARTNEWMLQFHVSPDPRRVDYLRRQHLGRFGCWMMPYGSKERTQICGDFVLWTCADDNLSDERLDGEFMPHDTIRVATVVGYLIRILEAPEAPVLKGYGWADMLRDLRLRVGAIATPWQLARWIAGCKTFCIGLLWAVQYRRAGLLPSLNDYMTIRQWDVGMMTYEPLIDVVGEFELHDEDLSPRPIRALTEIMFQLVAWDNDLLSHYKESVRTPTPMNLVEVVAHDKGCSREDAVAKAIGLRDRLMCLFLALREAVWSKANDSQRRYITCLGHMIRGNIDYSVTSQRYLNPHDVSPSEAPWADLPTDYAPAPTDDSLDPLPFPSIAWWWDQLHAPALGTR